MSSVVSRLSVAWICLLVTACSSAITPTPTIIETLQPLSHPQATQVVSTNQPELEKTHQFVVSSQATALAEFELTQTAMPSATPLPTFPSNAPLCSQADLDGAVNTNTAGGVLLITVTLSNKSQTACTLQGMPNIQIVDGSNRRLDVDYYTFCNKACNSGGMAAIPEEATQTALNESMLYQKTGLTAGGSAQFVIIWQNWCQDAVQGGASVDLRLSNMLGNLIIPIGFDKGGNCDNPDNRSMVGVSEYTH
jgi:hypothetical protein